MTVLPRSPETSPARKLVDDLLAFSPTGRLLAVSLFDRSILILNPSTGEVRQVLISASGTSALAFSPHGTLANGTPAGTVQVSV